MKLFFIETTEKIGYDTYDSAVVVAENEDEAARIHPSGDDDDWNNRWGAWASSPDAVRVTYIGEAKNGFVNGQVVCASFNAG